MLDGSREDLTRRRRQTWRVRILYPMDRDPLARSDERTDESSGRLADPRDRRRRHGSRRVLLRETRAWRRAGERSLLYP